MYLNGEMAQSILEEISQVIKEDLNIMDETGLILASTNSERINTFHEGAHVLIGSQMEQLIVERDGDYNGCRRGVNLPIEFASETVGVIGITGDPKEVIKYGMILKKMTEMLLYENFRALELFSSKREKDLLMSDLVHGNIRAGQNEIEKRMKRNGINTNGPYSVAVIRNTRKPADRDSEILHKIQAKQLEQEIMEELSGEKSHVTFNGELYIVIAHMSSAKLYDKVKLSSSHLNFNSDISLLCAIGSAYEQYVDIFRSYNEAVNVLEYFGDKEEGIYLFNTVMLNFTINQLPAMHKENLRNQVFGQCDEAERADICQFIIAYFNANGSLNQLSEQYYAHKNTIQYRIGKINRVTGYDLRKMRDLFILYMAAICKE